MIRRKSAIETVIYMVLLCFLFLISIKVPVFAVGKMGLHYTITIDDYSKGTAKVTIDINNISKPKLKIFEYKFDALFSDFSEFVVTGANGQKLSYTYLGETKETPGERGRQWEIDTQGNSVIRIEYTANKRQLIMMDSAYNGYIGDESANFSGGKLLVAPSDVNDVDENITVKFQVPAGSKILTPWDNENGVYYPNRNLYKKMGMSVNPTSSLLWSNITIGNYRVYYKDVDGTRLTIGIYKDIPDECLEKMFESLCTSFEYYSKLYGTTLSKNQLFVFAPKLQDGRWILAGGWSLNGVMILSADYYDYKNAAHALFHRWNIWEWEYDGNDVVYLLLKEGLNRYYENKFTIVDFEHLFKFDTIRLKELSDYYQEYKSKSEYNSSIYSKIKPGPTDEWGNWNIYNRGSLICLLLDMKIMEDTSRQKSLDDVVRLLNMRYGGTEKPMTYDMVIGVIKEVTGKDYSMILNEVLSTNKLMELDKYYNDEDGDGMPNYVEMIRGTDPSKKENFSKEVMAAFKLGYGSKDIQGNILSMDMKDGYRVINEYTVWFPTEFILSTQNQVDDFVKKNLPQIILKTKEGKELQLQAWLDGYTIKDDKLFSACIAMSLNNQILPGIEYEVTMQPIDKWVTIKPINYVRNSAGSTKRLVGLRLKVDNENTKLLLGETKQLQLIGKYDDGTELDVTLAGFFTSSDGEIAKVDELGLVSPNKVGDVSIYAELNGLKAEIKLNIDKPKELDKESSTLVGKAKQQKKLINLVASSKYVKLKVGSIAQIKVTALYSDGSKTDVTKAASYKSSKQMVATIKSGTVKAIAKGKSVLTISYGIKKVLVTCEVVNIKP